MRLLFAFSTAMCLLLPASTATAASVAFTGTFLTQSQPTGGGAGSAFGAVPPAVAFSIQTLTIAEGASTGAIGPSFLSSHPNIGIASGALTINENGTNDLAVFSLNVARDGAAINGNIAMTFSGDLFSTPVISQATMDSLIASPNNTSAVTYSDTANAQTSIYTGNVTAVVPEPTGFVGLISLSGYLLFWRRGRSVIS